MGVLAGNVMAGGLASGFGAWIRGESFREAFSWGALGGGLAYTGKWISARHPEGGGLLGRQVAEVGHSVAENAARGADPWSELWLTVAFVRIRVRGDAADATLPVRVNLQDMATVAWLVADSETRLSARRSLTTGTFVFEVPGRRLAGRDGDEALGIARGSVVALSGVGDYDRKITLGHELVHVIQSDFMTRLVSSPLEGHLWRRLAWDARILPSLEVTNVHRVLGFLMRDLTEAEAAQLDRRDR